MQSKVQISKVKTLLSKCLLEYLKRVEAIAEITHKFYGRDKGDPVKTALLVQHHRYQLEFILP